MAGWIYLIETRDLGRNDDKNATSKTPFSTFQSDKYCKKYSHVLISTNYTLLFRHLYGRKLTTVVNYYCLLNAVQGCYKDV